MSDMSDHDVAAPHRHLQQQIDALRERSEAAIEERAQLRRSIARLEDHAHDPEPTEPPSEPVYGQREGPREVVTPPYPEGPGRNLGNGEYSVDQWYPGPEGTLRDGRYGDYIVNGALTPSADASQVAVFMTRDVFFADLVSRGERGFHDNQVASFDTKDAKVTAYNVTAHDAKGHAFEAGSGSVLRGMDLEAEFVAFNPHGVDGLMEDSYVNLVGDRSRGGHWGAQKMGHAKRWTFRRVNYSGGPVWADVACEDLLYEDCLVEGSPKRGGHNEITTGLVTWRYFTSRQNSWDRRLDDEVHGHFTAQNAPMVLEHGLIELAGIEIGFCQFDVPHRPGSSAGSAIRDTKITVAEGFTGYVFAIKQPELVEISNVVVEIPDAPGIPAQRRAKMGGEIVDIMNIPGVTVLD